MRPLTARAHIDLHQLRQVPIASWQGLCSVFQPASQKLPESAKARKAEKKITVKAGCIVPFSGDDVCRLRLVSMTQSGGEFAIVSVLGHFCGQFRLNDYRHVRGLLKQGSGNNDGSPKDHLLAYRPFLRALRSFTGWYAAFPSTLVARNDDRRFISFCDLLPPS
jgi:hypothetical protein